MPEVVKLSKEEYEEAKKIEAQYNKEQRDLWFQMLTLICRQMQMAGLDGPLMIKEYSAWAKQQIDSKETKH